MARILENRFPIDSVERKALAFGFPLNGPAVFVPTYTTREQTKANLINYLLTNKGERVFNPNFGADLRNLLFQNVEDNTSNELRAIIQSDINNYFPQVEIKQIQFDNQPDLNQINFTLTYTVGNFGITDDITILLQ
jgi:phage baseplate assembly protein W